MMLGAKAPDYDTGLLRAYALSQASKHSKSAHFSAKNGYFLMFWAGQVVKTPLTSKLASEFCLFDPGIIQSENQVREMSGGYFPPLSS